MSIANTAALAAIELAMLSDLADKYWRDQMKAAFHDAVITGTGTIIISIDEADLYDVTHVTHTDRQVGIKHRRVGYTKFTEDLATALAALAPVPEALNLNIRPIDEWRIPRKVKQTVSAPKQSFRKSMRSVNRNR